MDVKTLFDKLAESENIRPFQSKVAALTQDKTVTGIAYDSRKIEAGHVFVCIKGEKSDGHDYIHQAVKAKASAIVVEDLQKVPQGLLDSFAIYVAPKAYRALAVLAARFYDFAGEKLLMVGVTGTNGKTSVTHLIQAILSGQQSQKQLPTIGNDTFKVGLVGTLGVKGIAAEDYQKTANTTPMALEFQQILNRFVEEDYNTVAMEVSSHALDQDRVFGADFDVAVVTNLTQDHLDYHKTMANYFKAKAKLFSTLAPTAKKPKWTVINLDDEWASKFIAECPTNVNVLTYSLQADSEATIKAVNVNYTVNGATFDCITPSGQAAFKLNIAGQFGVYNALAAIAAAYALGVPLEIIQKQIQTVEGIRGRFEVVHPEPAVIVDYAHTPDGLENVLQAARKVLPEPNSRLLVVFGCGGDRDATKRPKMGAIAEQLATELIITSDNPRTEDPQQIISDIIAGIQRFDAKRMSVEPDRRKAIYKALQSASLNDIVVIAGKGHEDYQILKDETIHFDDKEETLKALKELGKLKTPVASA